VWGVAVKDRSCHDLPPVGCFSFAILCQFLLNVKGYEGLIWCYDGTNIMSKVELKDISRIHFIGIGGIGMSALVRFFLHEKKQVSGSDSRKYF
jgi:hypothetical protein